VSPITLEIEGPAEDDLARLDRVRQGQVRRALERLVATRSLEDITRHKDVRRLEGFGPPPHFRLRVGSLRVIFIRTETGIRVRRVRPRGEAYRD
jgi:mRNA-degrading endonuclease RelE of RelBE toxin-antitoxin system